MNWDDTLRRQCGRISCGASARFAPSRVVPAHLRTASSTQSFI